MCFHLSISKKAQNLEARYKKEFEQADNYEPIFHMNGFSFAEYPVISTEDEEQFKGYHWGLIPHWAKDDSIRSKTLNARSETVFEKPSFRSSIKTKRCLIPVTGFFENKTIGKTKQPYHISLKSDEIFSLGGIWAEWTDKDTGEIIKTFSILTTDANPLMADIHNLKKRQPVIISSNNESAWLDINLSKQDILNLCEPYPDDDMDAYEVSRDLNKRSVYTNTPDILNPNNNLF
ncbi:SOS response-associated peptidase [Candidatus Kapabacteria bacterium]|nr:SOS response-associated peptidase [Candidatus Kapabacteria bacterium]